MGLKTSIIIVKKAAQIEPKQLLQELGFKKLSKKEDATFENSFDYLLNTIYIGYYKDNLIIYDWKNVENVIKNENSNFEKILTNKFPNSEICFLQLVSTINFAGYKIIDNGKVIRKRISYGEGTNVVDEFGEILNEEKEIYKNLVLTPDGEKMYVFNDEEATEEEVGEEFALKICSRYFGVPLDEADELLYNTKFMVYKRNWWKFW